MGIYVKDLKKPEKCFECPLVGGYAEYPDRLYCPAVKPIERVEGETLPDWCPIIETSEDWSAQRFKNMDAALTRIEPIAEAIQAAGTAILEIINEDFTTKERSDEDRTEDA